MALAQHLSQEVRFQQQVDNAREYLIPFIEQGLPIEAGTRVMEIGCGEGGVLRPFVEKGAYCLGVDLSESRIETAKALMAAEVSAGKASFLAQNVYEESFRAAHQANYDLIMLKDTIEHIPEQEKFIPYLRQFLKPGGTIFFGFPPWRMPFGGHQQICRNKWASKLPWFHLLPRGMYASVLRAFGESTRIVEDLLEIKDTGISTARFERIIRKESFEIVARTHFLFNPIYRYKFGLKPRKQAALITAIPHFRDVVTTAGWYLVQPKG
ncbi:MAG: methyltransferase domain-containing protein [Bacteroidota bacterium]